MSHISTYQHIITKVDLFCQLAEDLGYTVQRGAEIQVTMFGSNSVEDAVAAIHINGWKYPLAINKAGAILYDHWGSESGSMERLHKLMQTYNEDAIITDIPLDIVENYYTEQIPNGDRKLVLECGT